MQFDAELLLLAMAPVFLACIGWEAWHLRRALPNAQIYRWADTHRNASLAVLGFPPKQIVAIDLVNLAFQFFVHTQATGRLGWLGYGFNTPSIHRAQYARVGAAMQDPRLREPDTQAFPASRKT